MLIGLLAILLFVGCSSGTERKNFVKGLKHDEILFQLNPISTNGFFDYFITKKDNDLYMVIASYSGINNVIKIRGVKVCKNE